MPTPSLPVSRRMKRALLMRRLDEETVAFVDDLNWYLCVRFGYRRRFAGPGASPRTVHASSKRLDLYLRLPVDNRTEWPQGTLIVARPGVTTQLTKCVSIHGNASYFRARIANFACLPVDRHGMGK